MPKKDRRANGDGSFYTRPDGTVQFRAKIGQDESGRIIRKSFYGSTKTECRKKYKAYLANPPAENAMVSPDITLKNWMEKYLSACRKSSQKATSYHQLELLRDKISDGLMRKIMREIKPIELQEFLNAFSESASESYICKMSSLLRSAFMEAQENDVLHKNPARKLKTPHKIQKQRDSFTRAEAEIIINFAKSYHKDTKSNRTNRAAQLIAVAVVTLICTGLRRGELLGLMHTDIDDNILHIRRGVYLDNGIPTVTDGVAKTYSSIRDIPIRRELAEMIRAVPKRGLYVFSSYSGRLMSPDNFNRAYESFFRALRSKYPTVRYLTPHCCRHTFATLSQRGGASIRSVQLMLGHTNIRTTALYSHPDMDDLSNASAAYMDYLGQKRG